jgi:hypothetical protein
MILPKLKTEKSPEHVNGLYASIDLGSNSFRMMIAKINHLPTGVQFQTIDTLRDTVRLAGGLNKDNELSEESMTKALAAILRFGDRLRSFSPNQVVAVATNTFRVARNAKKFVDEAEKLLGFPIDVISGNEEARLIYIGASHIAPMCVGKRLVFDIGGGSTEIIIGDGHEPKLLESLPIGCVSFSQRFFSEGVVDEENIKASKMRHCLIEKIQQNELYVANDIALGNSFEGSNGLDGQGLNGILLYGTNAVGKTSFIRALGISVIMAQAGLYVPATSFEFYPYKYIFTRIIGNDNLFKGLSTFAVEMSELRTILRLSDERSLVLGDELCSGTESISAASIFVAGIQMLEKKSCSFIFATHLHEITNYDEITSLHNVGCKHMSVIYDKEKDLLIYDRKLKDGPGTNMYGLEVCKSLNLPQDFLDLAHNIRMKYNPESNSLLDQKSSHFNAKHIKGFCEKCNKKMATEVHHLQYQQDADDKGIIKNNEDGLTFHKNHPANLLSICEQCHDEIHKSDKKMKKVKTTKGVIVIPL